MTVKELINDLTKFPDMNADVLIDTGNHVLEEPVSFEFEPSLYAVVIGVTKND